MSTLIKTSFGTPRGVSFLIINSLTFFCSLGTLNGRCVGGGVEVLLMGGKRKVRFGGCLRPTFGFNSTTGRCFTTHNRFNTRSPELIHSFTNTLKFRCHTSASGGDFLRGVS